MAIVNSLVDYMTYFFFDGKSIKIGKSKDMAGVIERKKTLQTGNPRKIHLVGITYTPEAELHEKFKSSRLNGEWFSLSAELLQFLSRHAFMPNEISHFVCIEIVRSVIFAEILVLDINENGSQVICFDLEKLSDELRSSMMAARAFIDKFTDDEIVGAQFVMEYETIPEKKQEVTPKAFFHIHENHNCKLNDEAVSLVHKSLH